MKLVPFFDAQERLDKKVVEVHGLEGKSLTADVTTALYVELGELAQEIGFFKYWKLNKKKDNQYRQWDEWADCFHFLLSLGNKYGHSDHVDELFGYPTQIKVNQNFNMLFNQIFRADLSVIRRYEMAVCALLTIGSLIGMTEEDMHHAYFEKNKVNYDRLASGY